MRHWLLFLGLGLAALTPSCDKQPEAKASRASTDAAPTQQVFQVKGMIMELMPAEKSVRIKHEEIPGYMAAMTMPFDVKDTNELAGLEVGDRVAFRMTVTDKDGWIDQLKKIEGGATNAPKANVLPSTNGFTFVRDADPLEIGDAMPDYHFTNQVGQAVSFGQMRGQAFAFTFVFTRCPYPTFCPLMSNNFRDVQNALLKMSNGPTNWHLFTVSFDPAWDTPERLKGYAEGLKYDPRYWSFLTSDLITITSLADQVGEVFAKDVDGPGISHNLRTVVVDAKGRVQTIFRENKWTPEELVAEIAKAAQVK